MNRPGIRILVPVVVTLIAAAAIIHAQNVAEPAAPAIGRAIAPMPQTAPAPGQPGADAAPPEVQIPVDATPEQVFQQAEQYRREQSYRLARAWYEHLGAMESAPADLRNAARVWAADTIWRERSDDELMREADRRLDQLIHELPEGELRARAAESLAELRRELSDWDKWEDTVEATLIAIKYWRDVEATPASKATYVRLNLELAEWLLDRRGGVIPMPATPALTRIGLLPPPPPANRPWESELITWLARNALQAAGDAETRTRALYLLGRQRVQYGWPVPIDTEEQKAAYEAWRKEGEDYLRQAAAVTPVNEYTDDALMQLAQHLQATERYVEAAGVLRKLVGIPQSPFARGAREMLNQIVNPSLYLNHAPAYAPASHIRLSLNYRNLDRATLRLERFTVKEYVDKRLFGENFVRRGRQQVPVDPQGEVLFERPVEGLIDDGKHTPQSKDLFLDPLEPGIYQATVISPKVNQPALTQLFFVSGLSLANRQYDGRADGFVADAERGTPIEGATIHVLQRRDDNQGQPAWTTPQTATTNADGIGGVRLQTGPGLSPQIMMIAEKDGHPARLESWSNFGYDGGGEQPPQTRFYVYTDRPAYRPNEKIQWKAIARVQQGEGWAEPDVAAYHVIIRDARGGTLHEGDYELSDFGTLSGELTVKPTDALGMLQIEFQQNGQSLYGAQFARVEEYKLPEFTVAVEPAAGPYRLGTAIPFTVAADYYFGGPVAGATAEIVVHRAPFWPGWGPIVPYGWFYGETMDSGGFGRGFRGRGYWPGHQPEEIVLTKTVTLGPDGRARVEIPAPSDEVVKQARENKYWGYSYRVEARVVDLSRREVIGNGAVKAALTEFAAYLNPERHLYLPGDPVKVELKTLDPNDQPVVAEGMASIYKRTWDPKLPRDDGQPGGNYRDAKVLDIPIATGEDGTALITFEPDRAGYYLVRFTARDSAGSEVEGEATVFVAGPDTTATGYRSGGVEITLDRKSYERGDTAQALITVRRPGTAVWFAVAGQELHEQRVIRMDGTSKLIPIEVTAEFEPNIFLTAVAMYDWSAFQATQMMMVPPARRFLDVVLTPARPDYQPGDEASYTVSVKDHAGQPVAAEFSLAVADAAVWAIQSELAEDIRKFFWGAMRGLQVNTFATPQNYTVEFWKPKAGAPGEYEQLLREDIPEMEEDRFGNASYNRGRGDFALMEAGRAMPASAPMAADGMVAQERLSAKSASGGSFFAGYGGDAITEAPAPRLRSDFSATAFWRADIVTGEDGKTSVTFTLPDSLTTWRATARGVTHETTVGEGSAEVKTSLPLMVRPQGPRFLVEGDVAAISAVLTNNTSAPLRVDLSLDGGDRLALAPNDGLIPTTTTAALDDSTAPVVASQARIAVTVPAGNQRRVDWIVLARADGEGTYTMKAVAASTGDAVEKQLPVHVYGIEQFVARSATIRTTDTLASQTLVLEIPDRVREGSQSLTVFVQPTLARAMVDALPYLADYPYGCTEQTLSRFVPAAITAQVIRDLGLNLPDLEAKLPDMIAVGLARLYDFQHADGGWAWWKDGDGDPFMTAYVVQGLAQARAAGVEVRPDVLVNAAGFLRSRLAEAGRNDEDVAAFILYALATVRDLAPETEADPAAYERLWPRRSELNAYTRALFALAAHLTGREEQARILARNMRNGLVIHQENNTAHWGEVGVHYRWSSDGVEATAFSLRALLAIEPDSELIDMSMRWLVGNRRGSRWDDTRETAVAILALADYIRARGETRAEWTADIAVNGSPAGSLSVSPSEIFSFEGKVDVPANLLRPGRNEVTVNRRGTGPLYASAWLTFFNESEKIEPEGNEVFVTRRFFRTRIIETAGGENRVEREPLADGMALASGDRVEVELTLKSLNFFEYVVIEDLKAAGMEPTQIQSGWTWGNGLSAHQELRDDRIAFFTSRLPEGEHILKYELRAEVPGVFHALPTLVHAMYVPEVRANSAGNRIRIVGQ